MHTEVLKVFFRSKEIITKFGTVDISREEIEIGINVNNREML